MSAKYFPLEETLTRFAGSPSAMEFLQGILDRSCPDEFFWSDVEKAEVLALKDGQVNGSSKLRLFDMEPIAVTDRVVLTCLATMVMENPEDDLASFLVRLQAMGLKEYKVGRGGSHLWVSRRLTESEKDAGTGHGWPGDWHRIAMVIERPVLVPTYDRMPFCSCENFPLCSCGD